MDRIVDIESEDVFLHVTRGLLLVEREGVELGRIALDDIGAVIVHAHGARWSNTVFTRLAERCVPIVICGTNHAPVSLVWPLEGHHMQGARMRAQLAASRPLQKRLWRQVIVAKIRMQGAALALNGQRDGAFDALAKKVRSGDPDNIEAQAARRYWRLMFGRDFTRDRSAGGINGLLNYGYTVLRAIVSRAICASGLHPTLGIFHANRANAFALADDLMEPYRPLVDQLVKTLVEDGHIEVTSETKARLATLSTLDLNQGGSLSPLGLHVQRLAHSLAQSFETGEPLLALPDSIALAPFDATLREEPA